MAIVHRRDDAQRLAELVGDGCSASFGADVREAPVGGA